MNKTRVFAIYPSEPEDIGTTLEAVIDQLRYAGIEILTWPDLDIPGRFIVDGILEEIDSSDFVLADISRLNFNVFFEIGYTLGKRKRIVLVLDESLNPQKKEITSLGLLDTIGYAGYENSTELSTIIRKLSNFRPLHFPDLPIDQHAPIYLVDTLFKTDASVRIISKIKKSRIHFRSFDPKEESRLSALEACRNVLQSVAVVVHLLSSDKSDWRLNNLRAAFVAGIGYGLDKEVLMLQEGNDPVPLDYRDLVCSYKHPDDVDKYLNELAPKVMEVLQSVAGQPLHPPEGFLEKLDLGSPAAENEIPSLRYYYMKTDEYNSVLNAGSRLAVGRKGSGKTALFFQVRDRLRGSKKTFVLDLKPQGHQLKRLKQLVLDLLSEAVREHAATAFWEYVLYLELCYKILEKDKTLYMHQHELFEPYQHLAKLYSSDMFIEEADFSERMLKLVNRISEVFREKCGESKEQYLTAGDVTSFVYQHDLPTMRKQIIEYLKRKERVVILFDNIDKGWPTKGIGSSDILLVRALLEATRKIEREFQKNEVDIHTTVFLRSDVYELLVEETPDRGKESVVYLDWTDPDLLREFIRRRIVYNDLDSNTDFISAWNQISISHVDGEESSQYLIERSLMRPRNLLKLVIYGKGTAVNLQHSKIQEEDIQKALETYSADISNEIGLEIRDVFPEAEDVLYCFIGASQRLSMQKVRQYLQQLNISDDMIDQIVEVLLWFSFLGVAHSGQTLDLERYIYMVHYDIKKLKKLAFDLRDDNVQLCIHKAFWPFLGIEPST